MCEGMVMNSLCWKSRNADNFTCLKPVKEEKLKSGGHKNSSMQESRQVVKLNSDNFVIAGKN